MSLNITTDYAIRIMMYLANYYDPDPLYAQDANCSGRIIAERMNIPYNYFLKIVPRLKDAGYLISFQGKRGGYAMATPPEAITLFDIIHAMDDDFILNTCTAPEGQCARNASEFCAVHYVLSGVQASIEETLRSVNLAQLASENKQAGVTAG